MNIKSLKIVVIFSFFEENEHFFPKKWKKWAKKKQVRIFKAKNTLQIRLISPNARFFLLSRFCQRIDSTCQMVLSGTLSGVFKPESKNGTFQHRLIYRNLVVLSGTNIWNKEFRMFFPNPSRGFEKIRLISPLSLLINKLINLYIWMSDAITLSPRKFFCWKKKLKFFSPAAG